MLEHTEDIRSKIKRLGETLYSYLTDEEVTDVIELLGKNDERLILKAIEIYEDDKYFASLTAFNLYWQADNLSGCEPIHIKPEDLEHFQELMARTLKMRLGIDSEVVITRVEQV